MSRPLSSILRDLLTFTFATALLSCSASNTPDYTECVTSPGSANQLPSPSQAIEVLKATAADWNLGEMLTYGSFYSIALPNQHVAAQLYSCVFEAKWEEQGPLAANMAYAIIPVFITEPGATPELSTSWSIAPSEQGCFIGLANYSRNVWEWYPGTLQGGITLDSFEPYDHPTEPYVLVVVCVIEDTQVKLDWLRFGPNIAPVADLDVDTEYGISPATFNFDMSDSIDPELAIDHYEWDWDNDGVFDVPEPNSPLSSHQFVDHGMHTVVGKVVDADGAEGTASVDVWVSHFVTEQLDETGHSPDAYLDDTGVIQVSYGSGVDLNELWYGQLDGIIWSTDIRDTVVGDTNIETAIAPWEAVDWVLFAYGNKELYAGAWTGSEWNHELLTADKSAGKPAMAVDGNDRPHVLGANTTGTFPLVESHFTHWYMDPGWVTYEVDENDQTGRYCDAAGREDSLLHGVYAGPKTIEDFYPVIVGCWEKPSGEDAFWTWESLSTEGNRYRRAVSLALTTDSNPRVCFVGAEDGDPFNAVHYMGADAVGATWSDEVVGSSAWDIVMALGPEPGNLPHIFYTTKHYDNLYKRVWYTYNDGSVWHTEFAWENPGVDMEDLVLVVDQDNVPHLFYTDKPEVDADPMLMHATIE
jgi:PKD repeat protein